MACDFLRRRAWWGWTITRSARACTHWKHRADTLEMLPLFSGSSGVSYVLLTAIPPESDERLTRTGGTGPPHGRGGGGGGGGAGAATRAGEGRRRAGGD